MSVGVFLHHWLRFGDDCKLRRWREGSIVKVKIITERGERWKVPWIGKEAGFRQSWGFGKTRGKWNTVRVIISFFCTGKREKAGGGEFFLPVWEMYLWVTLSININIILIKIIIKLKIKNLIFLQFFITKISLSYFWNKYKFIFILYKYNLISHGDLKIWYQTQLLYVMLVPFFLLTYLFMDHNNNNHEIPSFTCYDLISPYFFSFAFLFANKKVHNSMRK